MADGEVVKRATIKGYLDNPSVKARINDLLDKRASSFTTSLLSLVSNDALLAQAEPSTLFNAALTAASLNLPINKNLGFAHIIGYKNNNKGGIVEAQFQLGARGFKELAQRSGRYKLINQGDVREGELAGRDRLTGELKFNWNEDDEERGKKSIIGYFSYFELDNGFKSTLYMSLAEVTAHGKRYSKAFAKGYGPWKDNFEAMALKTVSKLNISKNGPLSVELEQAVNADQAVVRDDGNLDYLDGRDAIEGEKADDTTKDDIVAANKAPEPELPDNIDRETGEVLEDKAEEPQATPVKAKSVKEQAADFVAKGKAKNAAARGETATLPVDDDDNAA